MKQSLWPLLLTLAIAGCGTSSSASGSSATPTPNSLTRPTGQNHVHSIAVLPNNPRAVYLGGHYYLYRSDNGGRSWHPLLKQMMLSMALDPARPRIILGVSSTRGLLRTMDGGTHWKPAGASVPPGKAVGVAFTPTGSTAFAYGSGVYRSTDGGTRWSHGLSGTSVISLATGSGGTVYAASGNGLYVSHDDGKHWRSVSSIGTQPVIQVAAARNTAYAVTATVPLFKSTDGGRTWKPLNKAPFGIEFLGLSPANPNQVIANVNQRGFVATRDGGRTWQAAAAGIHDTNFTASTVRIAPSAPNIVYTGSWGIHFYASRDGGRHWTRTATLLH